MGTVRSEIGTRDNDPSHNGSSHEVRAHLHATHSRPMSALDRRSDHPRFYRDQLFEEFTPLVRRLLRQYGTDAEMRHDLAGEIYCLFCSFVEAYDPERGVPLKPYLVRQLTASVYTYVRRQWTRSNREVSETWSVAGSHLEPSYDPTASWIAGLSERQLLATLPAAIAQLPDRQQKVLLWRYYDEMPFEEIAGLLNVEASTCRSLLRHALNNLRKQMLSQDCMEASGRAF